MRQRWMLAEDNVLMNYVDNNTAQTSSWSNRPDATQQRKYFQPLLSLLEEVRLPVQRELTEGQIKRRMGSLVDPTSTEIPQPFWLYVAKNGATTHDQADSLASEDESDTTSINVDQVSEESNNSSLMNSRNHKNHSQTSTAFSSESEARQLRKEPSQQSPTKKRHRRSKRRQSRKRSRTTSTSTTPDPEEHRERLTVDSTGVVDADEPKNQVQIHASPKPLSSAHGNDVFLAMKTYMREKDTYIWDQEPLGATVVRDRLMESRDRMYEAGKCIMAVWEQKCRFEDICGTEEVRELLYSATGQQNVDEALNYMTVVRNTLPLADEEHLLAVLIASTVFHWVFRRTRAVIGPISGRDTVLDFRDDFISDCKHISEKSYIY